MSIAPSQLCGIGQSFILAFEFTLKGELRLRRLGSIAAAEARRLLDSLVQKHSNPALINLLGSERYVENFAAVDFCAS